MEQKKTLTADLEHSRHTRWLLGLVLALAIVVAALEFTSSNTEGSLDDLLSEEIPEDMEFVPNVENDEQLEALQPQAPVLAEELVEVTSAYASGRATATIPWWHAPVHKMAHQKPEIS